MSAGFRDYLEKLIAIGELERVAEEVDLRHVSARIGASKTALWFERVRGYDMGVVTGIVGSRARMGAALDCHHRDIGKAFVKRIGERKPPVMVNTGPVRDVIIKGDDIDLTALPVPADQRSRRRPLHHLRDRHLAGPRIRPQRRRLPADDPHQARDQRRSGRGRATSSCSTIVRSARARGCRSRWRSAPTRRS